MIPKWWHIAGVLAASVLSTGSVHAQLVPEIGYAFPSGGRSASTTEIILGGYDWTPDMQLFSHDPRVKLELLGPPSDVLVPEPPYWFGAKGRGPAWPLPREFKARLTVPSDVAPGLLKWQVANANGASPVGFLHIGGVDEVLEVESRTGPQVLPALPVTVSGRIRRIEEIDQFEFRTTKAGPVTLSVAARQLNSPLHTMVQIHDASGRKVLDVADSEGRDLCETFVAQANTTYRLSLHDLDFAGDWSYCYRVALHDGPQVLAAFPAAGRPGETQSIEFVGRGIATGADTLESVRRDVAFPNTPLAESFAYQLETPSGRALPFRLSISSLKQHVETVSAAGTSQLEIPAAVTGAIETRFGTDEYSVAMKKGEKWSIKARACSVQTPLDLELSIQGPDGKELSQVDDASGSMDPVVLLTAPADGVYRITMTDRSGHSGSRAAAYCLSVEPQQENAVFALPSAVNVPLGGQAKLALKVVREGGFKAAIPVSISNLPPGITVAEKLLIPEGKNDLSIDLNCAADVAATASLASVTANFELNGKPETRSLGQVLMAITMKPRLKISPEGLDDVRKVRRGSTFFAPLYVTRLEDFKGDIILEMTAKQQRHRQGLASGEFKVRPEETRVEYPIFVPEWMETTKTSRMIVNGRAQVADPKGNLRTLLQRMELRIGILPEGAFMKLAHAAGEPVTTPGSELRLPISVSRASEFRETVRVEIVPTPEQVGLFQAEPLNLTAEESSKDFVIKLSSDERLRGEQPLKLRALSTKAGHGQVMSETTVLLTIKRGS